MSNRAWLDYQHEVINHFRDFVKKFERQNDVKVKRIHSDNGGEYEPFTEYSASLGIEHTTTGPYTPESNGMAERCNHSLVEGARTTLQDSGLPAAF
mgnify:CR=1 FL=1